MTQDRTQTRRPLSLILSGLSVALIIGGGLAVLALSGAVSLATWVRSQPEPAIILFGDSMPPTLQNLDVAYLRAAETVSRGDIISYDHGGTRIAHRVVALPGETLRVEAGKLLVRRGAISRSLEEPYVASGAPSWDAAEMTVAPDHYVTLGDNRRVPSGREMQVVARQDIVGVVYRIIFPPWRTRDLTLPVSVEP
ncbi:MAG: signal peptidase I [Chloroflexi bacterium]|nr:signal peptidase I [Chloroflexota bacterium]